MNPPPATIDRIATPIASVDADEFASAQAAESTAQFWQSVDAYERTITERAEDHVATIALP